MTLKINTLSQPTRRSYNSDDVEVALKREVSQRTSGRNPVRQDEIIRELGKLRGAEYLAELWIANGLGTPEQFLASLRARARRLHDLFPNDSPIR